MPTKSGKPRVGERIRSHTYDYKTFAFTGETRDGTVTRRSNERGGWNIWVRWDGEAQERFVGVADLAFEQRQLTFVPLAAPPPAPPVLDGAQRRVEDAHILTLLHDAYDQEVARWPQERRPLSTHVALWTISTAAVRRLEAGSDARTCWTARALRHKTAMLAAARRETAR